MANGFVGPGAKILPPLPQQESWGETAGTALGQVLQGLGAKKKSAAMVEQLTALGFYENEARVIAQLPPQQQVQMMKALAQSGYQPGAQGETAEGGPSSFRGALGAPKPLTPYEQARVSASERKAGAAERKETRDYMAPFEAQYAKIEEQNRELEELKELFEKGDLQDPNLYVLMSKVGWNPSWLKGVDTERAEKLVAGLLRDAPIPKGGKATNFIMQNLKAALPHLGRSRKANLILAESIKTANKLNQLKHEVRTQIVRENNGIVPGDIEAQVRDRLPKETKRILKGVTKTKGMKFRKDLPELKTEEQKTETEKEGSYPKYFITEKGEKIVEYAPGKRMSRDAYLRTRKE